MKLIVSAVLFLMVPIFTMAQEISVFQGFWGPKYYQDATEISKQDVKSMMLAYKPSENYWKRKTTNEAFFYGTNAVGLGGAFWLGAELSKDGNERNLGAPSAVTFGGLLVSTIFYFSANKNARKAILTYNTQFDTKKTTYRLAPVGNSNGFGVALKF